MPFLSRRRLLSAAFAAALAVFAAPHPAAAQGTAGHLTVSRVWARASAGMAANGVVFLTVTNSGPTADRLVAASTPVSAAARLHIHKMVDGVAEMRGVASVAIPAGATVTFRPGGLHVMLMKLKAPLKQGQTFPVTLTFAKAGPVTVEARVGSAGAMDMPGR